MLNFLFSQGPEAVDGTSRIQDKLSSLASSTVSLLHRYFQEQCLQAFINLIKLTKRTTTQCLNVL